MSSGWPSRWSGCEATARCSHDVWAETIVDVDLYFDARGWEVEWIDSPDTTER